MFVYRGREDLVKIITEYPNPRDVYNQDELGLNHLAQPAQTLSKDRPEGSKTSKARVTISLCVNSDGSDKRKPLVIGSAMKPRCFRGFDPDLYVTWTANKRAWMTSDIYQTWLNTFDRQMTLQGRRVCLIVDNAPAHKIVQLKSVKVVFLPPGVTSKLQPLDAGIIRSFKARYRRLLGRHFIDCLDANQPMKADMRQVIRMVADAWDSVTPTTIQNCWRHVGLVTTDDRENAWTRREVMDDDVMADLQAIIERLPHTEEVTAAGYVGFDTELMTQEDLSDDTIIDIVQGNRTDDVQEQHQEEEEEEEEPKPLLTTAEARLQCMELMRYAEEKIPMSVREQHLKALRKFYFAMEVKKFTETKQTSIRDFFKQ